MPRRRGALDAFLSDRVHQRLRGRTLRSEIDEPREDHARVEEDDHGQRFRSSSINAAMSTEGRSLAATVGLATRRRPTFTSRGPAAVRVSRMPSSSSVISSSEPGARPARSRRAAGMTTRPALSMVVRMVSVYHAWFWCSGKSPQRIGRHDIDDPIGGLFLQARNLGQR